MKKTLIPIFICILIAGLISGCSKDKSDKLSEDEAWLIHEGETSLDLINNAVKEGKLDYETSLEYKAYALFDDNKLPQVYLSDVESFEGDDILFEIRSKFSSLSQEKQKMLSPFLKRPDDPESYFNKRFQESERTDKAAISGGIVNSAYAARPEQAYQLLFPSDRTLISGDGKIKIWYPYASQVSQANAYMKMAEDIKTILDEDQILKKFVALMDRYPVSDGNLGGDAKLDLYIYMNMTRLGLATNDHNSFPSSVYIFINQKLKSNRKELKTVVAHEVFHAVQAAYKQNASSDVWWREATATWSEDFIYPNADTEQSRLKLFLPYSKKSLDSRFDPNDHEYGAYIFPFYITQKYGDDLMKKIWEMCGSYQECLDAIDAGISGGFQEHWKEFTLWNYNRDHVRKYKDESGNFSSLSSIDSQSTKKVDIVKEEIDITVDVLEMLSAQLIKATNTVNRSDVKKIIFSDLNNFTSQSENASIQAVVYFKDKAPAVEDWTDRKKRTFCIKCDTSDEQKCKEEDFEKIVLIFGNGDKEKDFESTEINVKGEEDACSGTWQGTLKVTQDLDLTGPFVGSWHQIWTVEIKEELEEVEIGETGSMNKLSAFKDPTIETEYHVMTQDIKYTYKETSRAVPITGSGHVKRKHPHPDKRGGLIDDDTKLDTIVRIIKMKDYSNKGPQAVLGLGEYYFIDDEGIYGNCNFVKYSDGKIKCPKYIYDTGGTFIGGGDLRGYLVTPTGRDKRIKGSDSSTVSFMKKITTKMEWDYKRVYE